jgi:hypothetical protein
MQAAFDDFYVAQAKRTLEQSNLDKAGKTEALNRVIVHHTESKRESA